MVARFAENQFVDKEKQVIESREREKLDSIYSLFISDLANYLIKNNNTIHAILKKIRSTEFGSTQKEMIKGTIKSSSQFGEFLQGISTLSKIDMNKIDNSPITQIRLKTLIQRVLDRFDNEAKQNSIKFINYVGADIELKVNNELLDAIVQNVISNAVKYSPQGKKIEISAEAKANKVLIEIKDYGFGIESSNTEKIFEKFYRVKDDHVYNKKGSGIGLYLSKLFANHLGGDVTLLTSNLGEGSTFCIKVPKNV